MSATTQTLRQRHGIGAYHAARAEAIRTSERRALRVAEQEWRAQPRLRLAAAPTPRPSRLDRTLAALWHAHDHMRAVWVLLAGIVIAADVVLAALYLGAWQP